MKFSVLILTYLLLVYRLQSDDDTKGIDGTTAREEAATFRASAQSGSKL